MIRAVANADCRFSALLQNASAGSFVVGGFGYNFDTDARVPLTFNYDSAVVDTLVRFHYTDSINCAYGQGAVPYDVDAQVEEAIKRSTGPDGTGTGIIRHPFDADYGYPAYDFDYWTLPEESDVYEWQAGWNYAYWSFYVKASLNGDFEYPEESGIATHPITNHSVSGFVFETNVTDFPPPYAMTGNFTAPECNCGCNAAPARAKGKNQSGKRK
jgi:hypothetical protein